MATQNKYFIPKLSAIDLALFRVGGPGLGNLLFPISRAYIGARKSGGIFLNGTFPQVKLGPLIRMEKDKRYYRREFAPLPLGKRAKKIYLMCRRSTTEGSQSEVPEAVTVIYSGLGEYFYPLLGSESDIRKFLYDENYYPLENRRREGAAVHLRFGDFASAQASNGGGVNTQNSIEWYWSAMDECRSLLGNQISITLFSDDPVRAKQAFPDLPVWEKSRNALSEILTMSQYEALIGANSTFSLWASFLSEGISIWHKKFDLERYRQRDDMDRVV